jgi:2-polyprenyl-3-methyl-5-hydroxy-6-metoxy-1,4-benzoquinol methylase
LKNGSRDEKILSFCERDQNTAVPSRASSALLAKEERFHDQWASQVDVNSILVDELPFVSTLPEIRAILNYVGNVKGKRILELGCGFGEMSVYWAKQGADVIASDLSSGMLQIIRQLAELHKVAIKTYQCSADNTKLQADTFDIVYCGNLLHHVDILSTLKEIKRLLKPGGIFVSWDPIAYNPLINVYRKLAKNVRTEDEHPLKRSDIHIVKTLFPSHIFSAYWLFTLVIFLKFYFLDKINPNQERYWKKIVTDHKKLSSLYYKLEKIDHVVLKYCPCLKWLCWNAVLMCRKD